MEQGELRPIRVLLAEDDPAARTLMKALFDGRKDLELCAAARDGFEALELVEQEAPDFLLLDLVMPGLDGIGVLRALAEYPPQRRPRVVVISRVNSVEITNRCIDLGASYFLIKPLEIQGLFELLRALYRDELREKAQSLLLEMGAPEGHAGVRQGSAAAAAMARSPGGTMLLKEAYYEAGDGGRGSYARTEKNIRTMIRTVHRAASPAYRALMGGTLPARQPANGVFLRRLAELLMK